MSGSNKPPTRRVLIASSHPLFGQGLRSLLQERSGAGVEVVGVVANLEEALEALERIHPDLIVVDYDDKKLNRDEFLARFVEGERKLRVVLLSLQSGKDALVYDRRTLAASQIDNWLEEWTYGDEFEESPGPSLVKDISAQPKSSRRRNDMKHFAIVAVLVIVITALLIVGLNYAHLLPAQASAQAVPIDSLFNLEFKVIAFLFALIVVFLVYSIVVFRRKSGDLKDAAHIQGNTKLEVAWTVAPLITVVFFAYLGGQSLAATLRADPNPLRVKVIGQQWSWRFEYPDLGIVSDTLRVPVNKQSLLLLSSVDVIHSFWVPQFRVKQDALPGGDAFVKQLRVTPTELGQYQLLCAELCGERHTYMTAPVIVSSQADFDAWVASETTASNDPEARGQKIAKTSGCLACHSLDGGKMVGPTWKSLSGSTLTLNDGSSVTADEAYLKESIVDPDSKIVQGFPPGVMPGNYGQRLTDQQIADLIAFINSLK
jgi:cytochrome c oxidase subunit 2